jgi:hypothetical protein
MAFWISLSAEALAILAISAGGVATSFCPIEMSFDSIASKRCQICSAQGQPNQYPAAPKQANISKAASAILPNH